MKSRRFARISQVIMSTGPDAMHPTKYWRSLKDGRVQCDLCPRSCRMREGQRGLCFVRENSGGKIVLSTYGRSSGYCVDPIEKKPLFHFLPGSPVLSFGTAGCNLACKFCQNWDISKSRDIDTLCDTALPETIARAAVELGCRSVAFTYNDPVVFMEYAIDVAKACRDRGIRTVAVTAGYICEEPREEFFRYIDAVNVDLKALNEEFYRRLTGGHLQPVLDTLTYLRRGTGAWIELTMLLIPGHNDSVEEIDELTAWVVENLGADTPMHFTAFHPDWKMRSVLPTSRDTVMRAREIAIRNGARYAYTGNISTEPGESTYCPGCGVCVIGRDRYALTTWRLGGDGTCLSCGMTIAGRFEARPGTWGRNYLPVNFSRFAA